MKEISDNQKDLSYALGEQAAKENESVSNNPFKKTKENRYWWTIGFENHIKDKGTC